MAITNLTLQRTGHFALLATNVTGLYLNDLRILPERDGLDIVSCRDVLIENIFVEGLSETHSFALIYT
jgi:polygalacturonase